MKNSRILLINCPSRLTRPPEFFPYGLSLISSVLKNKNFEVEIYDLNLHRDIKQFLKFLNINNKWEIIGLSGIVTTYELQLQLAQQIREAIPEALIVSGGGLASTVPELLLKNSEIEVSCIGEGEAIILELVKAWWQSRDISQIKGIYWKNRYTHEIIKNETRTPICDLDSIPFPDWEGANFHKYLIQYSSFYNKGIMARNLKRRGDLTTTRGCPYKCSFCANVFDRQSIRSRSIENVIEEIKILEKRYNIDSIDFLDELFCYSRNRVIQFCEKVLKEGLNIHWGTASRVDHVDKELLQLMKKAGCIFLLFGFETGSQKILDCMKKGISFQQSWQTFQLTEESGIDAMGNLIIGHPGENHQTIIESRDFQRDRYNFLKDIYSNRLTLPEVRLDLYRRFKTVSFVVPFPGTYLYQTYRHMIGDLDTFMKNISLNDACQFVVNLSELPTIELIGYQQILSNPCCWDKI
jgi:anaerobic magnesium-protoporphyrin IX monomethyl ester cyclase